MVPFNKEFNLTCNGLPGCLSGKESTCQFRRCGSGRSPEGGNANPSSYPGQNNPKDKGACQAIVQRVTESQIQLSVGALTCK